MSEKKMDANHRDRMNQPKKKKTFSVDSWEKKEKRLECTKSAVRSVKKENFYLTTSPKTSEK